MKRLLAILLTLALALSLTACTPYADLIKMLDNKDYEGAIAYIYDLYQKDMGVNNPAGDNGNGDGNDSTNGTAVPPTTINEELEEAYWRTIDRLKSFIESKNFSLEVDGEWVSYRYTEGAAKLHEMITELGDYKGISELLTRFTVTGDCLLKEVYSSVDAFGQESGVNSHYLIADSNGVIQENMSNGYFYTYDDQVIDEDHRL